MQVYYDSIHPLTVSSSETPERRPAVPNLETTPTPPHNSKAQDQGGRHETTREQPKASNNIGALIIRIGFGGIYHNEEPPKQYR